MRSGRLSGVEVWWTKAPLGLAEVVRSKSGAGRLRGTCRLGRAAHDSAHWATNRAPHGVDFRWTCGFVAGG